MVLGGFQFTSHYIKTFCELHLRIKELLPAIKTSKSLTIWFFVAFLAIHAVILPNYSLLCVYLSNLYLRTHLFSHFFIWQIVSCYSSLHSSPLFLYVSASSLLSRSVFPISLIRYTCILEFCFLLLNTHPYLTMVQFCFPCFHSF